MNSTTRNRKTTSPVPERWATSLPQLAPISSCEMASLALATPVVSAMMPVISVASSVVRGSVCTTTPSLPWVVTMGDDALSMSESETASRSLSAMSWVAWSFGSVTVNWAPPVNSIPMLSPLTLNPRIAIRTSTPEMAYQSQRRPMKSTDFLPV